MTLVQFSGLASGIDSASLIEALLEQQRQATIEPFEKRVSEYEDQNEALKELGSLLSTLSSAAESFRLLSGGGVAKQSVSSDETVLTAAAGNAALPGIYDLTVTQTAKNGTLSLASTGGSYASTTDAIAPGLLDTGNNLVQIDIGSAAGGKRETIQLAVTGSTTLNDFVNAFNTQSSSATASIVNLGTGGSSDYVIMINSNKTGLIEGELSLTVGSDLSAAAAFDNNSFSQARNALFAVDGVSGTIERQSNTVSDLLPGLTFSLESIGSASVAVSTDPDSTLALVEEFVEAYNDVVNFVIENDTVERQEDQGEVTNIFGPLASTSVDDNVLSALRTALTNSSTSGGQINILAELGMTSERDGTLKLDAETFKSSLLKDPESTAAILQKMGEKLAATDGTIAQFTRFNGLIDLSIRESDSQVSSLQTKIADAEKRLSQQEENLSLRFARLEGLMSQMQSQQSSLSSILQSL